MIWMVQTELGPLTLREQIEPEDEPGLLALFGACDDWFEATTGGPSGPGDVQGLFYSLPEGTSFDDKRLFTVRDGDRVVGLVDAVLGYPDRQSCAVGHFLIAPTHRRKGVATAVANVLLGETQAAGIQRVTATADENWPNGLQFLRSLGFDLGDPQPGHTSEQEPASRRERAGQVAAARAASTRELAARRATLHVQ